MKIVFIHPDLGIGGAERLVVDAAVALQSAGHSVQFLTNHHDPKHCFQETQDGTLKVTVVGNNLPRYIFGKCAALCAYVRIIVAAFYLVYKSGFDPDIIFCDQVSVCIPILKLSRARIVFYCHFPDQLLTQRKGVWKRLYRAPLDWMEEITTGMADVVLVNSKFTEKIFRQTFRRLDHVNTQVLYPSLNFSQFDRPMEGDLSSLQLKGVSTVFLSLNRFERKKNLELAILALEKVHSQLRKDDQSRIHLIVAGGYDPRLKENCEYFSDLETLTKELKLTSHVTFLKSPADSMKHLLIHSCTAVVYTPENEHFGIVPLEAMYMSRPVIATNTGGPLETIVDGETGFHCDPNADNFALSMLKFVKDRSLARELGVNGNQRVKKEFSYSTFQDKLEKVVQQMSSSSTKSE